jgi:hypothetical protein
MNVIESFGSLSVEDLLRLLMLAVLVIWILGGAWMFWDASERFGTAVALALIVVHAGVCYALFVPYLVVFYGGYRLYEYYLSSRKIPEDDEPKFGLKISSGDPDSEARQLDLPSVYKALPRVPKAKRQSEETDDELE